MKKIFIYILSLILILIFSFASVSASDINDTIVSTDDLDLVSIGGPIDQNDDEIISTNDVVDNNINDDEISRIVGNANNDLLTSSEKVILSSKSSYDLRNLIQNADNGSIIELDSDYTFTSSIMIEKSITIDGKGFAINGKNNAKAFNIYAENVVLKNIKFDGLYSVISTSGMATDKDSQGGAIVWNANNGLLENCTFNNCNSIVSLTYIGDINGYSKITSTGGAVMLKGTNITIDKCNFINCMASATSTVRRNVDATQLSSGGAIYIIGRNTTISNCNFNKCSAFSKEIGSVVIHNAKGGAIGSSILYDDCTSIFNCAFINCSSISSGEVKSGNSYGGAISLSTNSKIYNSTFENCSSISRTDYTIFVNSNGGAINLNAIDYINCNNVPSIIDSCIFKNNSASNGGAIYIKQNDTHIFNSIFLNNQADEGNSIYWNKNNGIIKDSILLSEDNCDNIYSKFNLNANYNWWGNTMENYNVSPKCSDNVKTDNWLILNLTESKNSLEVGEFAIIKFDLNNLFDNNQIINYIASKQLNINLSIIEDDNIKFNIINGGFDEIKYFAKEDSKGQLIISYGNILKMFEFNIEKASISQDEIVLPSLNEGFGTIILNYDAIGTITLVINNKSYSFPVINGTATIYIPDLNNGNYSYTITYSGDQKYSPFTKAGNVTINNVIPTVVSAASVTTVYNGGKYLIVTLKDNNGAVISGATVSINFNGVKYFTTDPNGQVKISTNGLVPKSYTVSILFAGNNYYEKSTATVKVTVKKATPKITAKAKTFKKSVKTKKYTITLKNNLNKVMKNTKVTIKINKKTYSAKTNSKGVATFKITKLTKKSNFKSIITYKGSKYYNKVTKTVKIKIK